MIEHYKKNGYELFRSVLPVDEVTALGMVAYDAISRYRGELRRQDGQFAVNAFYPDSMLVRNSILNAHFSLPDDLSQVRLALRHLITCSAIYEMLHSLDGAEHYTVHQTIIFLTA